MRSKEGAMKKSTSFRLSDKALDALQELAARFGKSKAEVLEFLILDRYSVSDPWKNAARREWIITHTKEEWEGFSPEQIYRRGYSAGWRHFQIRHSLGQQTLDGFVMDEHGNPTDEDGNPMP